MYQKSYNLIYDLKDVKENKFWYEKFNPIKIFKKNEENNSNAQIQSIE